MIKLRIGTIVVVAAATLGAADAFGQSPALRDLTPQPTFRPQTDSERLQNFQPPPSAPPQPSFQDRITVPLGPNTGVRPDMVGPSRAPGVTFEHRF